MKRTPYTINPMKSFAMRFFLSIIKGEMLEILGFNRDQLIIGMG